MPTITVRLDDETDTRLKRRLVRSGESLSELVRAAVVNQLAAGPAIRNVKARCVGMAGLPPLTRSPLARGWTIPSNSLTSDFKEKIGRLGGTPAKPPGLLPL